MIYIFDHLGANKGNFGNAIYLVAEAKAKNMEDEMFRLYRSLEERNRQSPPSASSAEKRVFQAMSSR